MAQKKRTNAVLRIILKADDTHVIESTDPILWQKVLGAINAGSGGLKNEELDAINTKLVRGALGGTELIDQMAKDIRVSADVLKGACAPSESEPFIHLDKHHWEAMKKGTPNRGPGSIAPIALAGTLLALWKEKINGGDCAIGEAQKVLKTVGVKDKHPKRALRNCEWLQVRGSNVIINPAQISKAIALARLYCTKEWGSSNRNAG